MEHVETALRAYVDLVKAWGWKSFTIIYENNEGLVRLQELLKAHGPSEFPITVRQLSEGSEYRVSPNTAKSYLTFHKPIGGFRLIKGGWLSIGYRLLFLFLPQLA
ncbi:hypothetical protein HZH68_012932 [Vespula germanica]|uniref:Receptor ligand binding region domain-containing protein n=2 Tax=Vespula TaxID=7451 RepID=A0A834MVX7_VESGE|nr:hypothetical protein HZH68_012932 [Vespula germanica]KAF7409254.1 hypothetical protein H0235_014106 [Vespula pensylvanica]